MRNIRANNLEVLRNPGRVTENFELAVATVVLCIEQSELMVLLAQRKLGSEAKWALPGGVLQVDEPLEEAARRMLQKETEIKVMTLRQFQTFGQVDRYPGKRVVTVAFYTLMRTVIAITGTNVTNWKWFRATAPPVLAIDHNVILEKALKVLQRVAVQEPIAEELLPDQFTMGQLQTVYEAILQRKLDPVRFRRQIWGLNLLIPLPKIGSALTSEMIYRFNLRKYRRFMEPGLWLDI